MPTRLLARSEQTVLPRPCHLTVRLSDQLERGLEVLGRCDRDSRASGKGALLIADKDDTGVAATVVVRSSCPERQKVAMEVREGEFFEPFKGPFRLFSNLVFYLSHFLSDSCYFIFKKLIKTEGNGKGCKINKECLLELLSDLFKNSHSVCICISLLCSALLCPALPCGSFCC